MAKRPPCGKFILRGQAPTVDDDKGRATCAYPRMAQKRQCGWHWLDAQDAMTQATYARARLARVPTEQRRPRVDKSEWPDGERWCSGCQTFVPLFYVSGSRCKSCTSEAAHAGMVAKTYGITSDDYAAMYELQGGRCYICQRQSPSRRLAVDHDHDTGVVRGLLCPDPERGCNHAILGPLEASPGGALAAARRMVDYLVDPPYDRIKRGESGMATHEPPKRITVMRERTRGSGYVPSEPIERTEGYEPPPF